MRPVRALAIIACLALATGCTAGRDRDAARPAGTTLAAAGGSAAGTATTALSRAAGTASAGWSSRPAAKVRTGAQAQLVAVRAAHHDGFDRVTFEFRSGPPGWRVGYVAEITGLGSGQRVPVQGLAFLSVLFDPANAHTEAGVPTWHGPRLTPRLPSLRQVVLADDFEAQLAFGLGLSGRVGFRVMELTGPPRVAVDVAA
jgi:hypothetical protein